MSVMSDILIHMKKLLYQNLGIQNNNLTISDVDTEYLAKKYGTPLYVLDENRVRENCRMYFNAMKYFKEGSSVIYAGKALSFKMLYKVVESEYLGFDVNSIGEIYTLLKSGCTLKNAYFHSNSKTDDDIKFAIDYNIGYFVVDNIEEAISINNYAHKKQNILLRVTPGIDPHTFEAVNTGKIDSKFGNGIDNGIAMDVIKKILKMENINLCGIHSHVGSLIFDDEVFISNVKATMNFIKQVKDETGYVLNELDLGGGFPVRYIDSDPEVDINSTLKKIAEEIKKLSSELNIDEPIVHFEPGRSIVAEAGYTLYTVQTIKKIPGYKNYVSIDGGMTDNPRFALYKSKYTIYCANKMNEKYDFEASVVGRCCESGDIIGENIMLPKSIQRNDLLCVLTTGAYNHSMSSNYNGILTPAIIMLKDGKDCVAVERQYLDDLIKNDNLI